MNSKIDKSIANLEDKLKCINTSNLSAALVETFSVNIDGQQVPIKYLGHVLRRDNKIQIELYDLRLINTVSSQLQNSYKISKNIIAINILPPSIEERDKNIKYINYQLSKLRPQLKILLII